MVRFPAPVASSGRDTSIRWRSCPRSRRTRNPPCSVRSRLANTSPARIVLLRRNPNYWKHDANGRQLPYLDSIRLDIQQNRELELLRFRRGELDIVNKLDPEMYDRLNIRNAAHGGGCRTIARLGSGVLQSGGNRAAARVQAALVPVHRIPARHLRGHQSRRHMPHRVSRPRPSGGRPGFGFQSLLDEHSIEAARVFGECRTRAAAARRVSSVGRRVSRSRRTQSRVFDDHERGQQAA